MASDNPRVYCICVAWNSDVIVVKEVSVEQFGQSMYYLLCWQMKVYAVCSWKFPRNVKMSCITVGFYSLTNKSLPSLTVSKLWILTVCNSSEFRTSLEVSLAKVLNQRDDVSCY